MKAAVFSFHEFERNYFTGENFSRHDLKLLAERLTPETTHLASGCKAAIIFVNDDASGKVLEGLKRQGVEFLVLRSAGYDHVDLQSAQQLGIRVAHVPGYSPYAVAEHAVALLLALNRNLIPAHERIMELNFSLDGLVGFDMYGKTVGIVGTGKIGSVMAKIMHGFGCNILVHDEIENEKLKTECGVAYVGYKKLCNESDIITFHVPLTEKTRHLVNKQTIAEMKKGVMLINTSRGAIVNAEDVIEALKSGRVGSFGMDVYEKEKGLYFENHSMDILQDDVFARLMTFRNVLISGHQAFLTSNALENIARTTNENLDCFENKIQCVNELLFS